MGSQRKVVNTAMQFVLDASLDVNGSFHCNVPTMSSVAGRYATLYLRQSASPIGIQVAKNLPKSYPPAIEFRWATFGLRGRRATHPPTVCQLHSFLSPPTHSPNLPLTNRSLTHSQITHSLTHSQILYSLTPSQITHRSLTDHSQITHRWVSY